MMKINLLPWRMYQRERRKRMEKMCGGFIILCLIAVVAYVKFFQTTISVSPIPQKQLKKIVTSSIISLQTVSVYQMKLAGFIQHNDLNWALIRLPNDKVEVIKIHDKIGKEQATVVKISEQEVVVRDSKQVIHINYSLMPSLPSRN